MDTLVPTLHISAQKNAEFNVIVDVPEGIDQVIGRDLSVDIVIPDPAVSRRHARLSHDAQGVWLDDLGSANGTYINGTRVTDRCRLQDQDHVRLGESVAIFHDVARVADPTVIVDGYGPALGGQPRPAEVAWPEPAVTGEARSSELAVPQPPVTGGGQALPVAGPGPIESVGSQPPEVAGPRPVAGAGPGPVETVEPQPLDTPAHAWKPASPPAPAPPPPGPNGHEAVSGTGCRSCGTENRPELWFCTHCGYQQRPIALQVAGSTPGSAAVHTGDLITSHGEVRRQPFKRAMRANNGGQRVRYNEGLSGFTIAFRCLAAFLLLVLIIGVLVALADGVTKHL